MFQLFRVNLCICTIVYFLTNYVIAQNAKNFVVEHYEPCRNLSDPTIKAYVTFQNFVPGGQIVDANLSSPIPIGENALLIVSLEIEAKSGPPRWIHLFSAQDDYCRMIQMYIGEFWYDIERAAAVNPRTCPIPRGNYHLTNHKLNFQLLKLQTFPFGRLRITMQMQEKTTKKYLSCSVVIIGNRD